jgi:DNA-directed RNA polymerase specialized sigma24 family protein
VKRGWGAMTFNTARRRARDPVQRDRDPVRRVLSRPERPQAAGREPGIRGDELALAYAEHSRSLLKLAALLVPDISAAREVVYESFAALHREQQSLRSHEDVFAFLLRNVVARARAVVARSGINPSVRSVAGGDAVIRAVRGLPDGQREALVLRYYAQLSDEQAAAAMGVRTSVLRVNVARGMAGLRAVLGSSVITPG